MKKGEQMGLMLQRARQLANARAATVPVLAAEFDRDLELWPEYLDVKEKTILTNEERSAAQRLLNNLDTIEPHVPAQFSSVNQIISAVEASPLTTDQRTAAIDALRECDGRHLISANLAGPCAYSTIEAMRAGLEYKINLRER